MSSIVKFKRSEDSFEHISRVVLQDQNLSLDALGALCRLLSLPGDWEWQCWQLEKEVLKVGRDKRKRIFNELIQAGYLITSRSPNGVGGGWQHTYNLFRTPQKLEDFSGDVKHVAAKSAAAKGVDKQNTDLQNTELYKTQQQPAAGAAEPTPPAKQVSGGGDLIFDKAINQTLHQQLAALLENIEVMLAQQMLDALAQMGDKAHYPLKLIKSFVENPSEFDPTPGLKIAAARKNKKVFEENLQAVNLTFKPDATAAAAGEAMIQKLRKKRVTSDS